MFGIDQAVSTAGFDRNQLGIVHHGLGQHGFDKLRNVHQFKPCDFAVLVFGADGFGQDDVENIQDFVVDTAINGAQTIYLGGRSDMGCQRSGNAGFFFAFAADGFRRLFGSTALCGLRRPIQKRKPSSVSTNPFKCTA